MATERTYAALLSVNGEVYQPRELVENPRDIMVTFHETTLNFDTDGIPNEGKVVRKVWATVWTEDGPVWEARYER